MPHRRIPHISRSIMAPFLCALLLAVLAGPHRAGAEDCAESPAGVQAGKLYSEGESEAALPYAREALGLAEQKCGARSTAIVILLTDLGAIYQNLGYYAEAEKQLKRVIDIKQAALSPEEENKPGAARPDMIIDLDNLAFVYGAQGKFVEAGELFERVLAIAEHAVGGKHIIVAQALRNLAENYRAEGRYDEASPLLTRAAQIEAEASDDNPAEWATELGLTSPKQDADDHQSEDDAPSRLPAERTE